jgi:hypothetical protein
MISPFLKGIGSRGQIWFPSTLALIIICHQLDIVISLSSKLFYMKNQFSNLSSRGLE